MDETFMKARAYLAQNYSDPELSLTDLCHYLGFSCSYFSTLFKQKTGLNYSRYITSLRLEQAPPPTTSAVLLKNFMGSPHPVTENKTEFLPCNIQRQELFS